MDDFAFVANPEGFRALMNSSETQAMLLAKAERVASAATSKATYKGAAYAADVRPGKNRAHARASSTTSGGYWAALRQKTLASSLTEAR